ncbi:MAG: hypothetical protein N3B01_06660 [Verrucomicrobiae bacterium]|nr:hypothetical protein [Verrucomicrobiae bacterium]
MVPAWYKLTVAGLFVLAAIGGGWFALRKKNWQLLDRVVAGLLGVGFLALAGMVAKCVLQAPFFGWNAARLAPTFALVKGYRLYYPDGVGPVLNTIYGPVTALVYLPAVLGQTPTAALVIASTVSAALFFAPWVWLTAACRDGRWRVLVLAAVLCFGLLTLRSYPLNYGAFCIHADAPALGFGGLACVALYLMRRADDWVLLAVSAVAAALSVSSKQTIALLPLGLAVCVWRWWGVRALRRYVVLLAVVGLGLSLLFVAWFGLSAMFFNMVVVPGRHPWQGARLEWLQRAALELLAESWPALVVVAAGAVVSVALKQPLGRWTVFAVAGAVNAGGAVLNRVKVGGDLNAFNLSLYFWLIGAALLVVEAARAESALRKVAGAAAKALLTAGIIGLLAIAPSGLQNLYRMATVFRFNQQEVACRLLRQNPGILYFPNTPLAHLMAEGRLYHLSYAMIDRRLSGFPLRAEHFRAHIPQRVRVVVFGSLWSPTETETHAEILRFLPGFVLQARDPAGWAIYVRPG